jgi:hypothetical protein
MMIEAASISEKSVNFNQTTRRNNPEDSHLHIRRRDNLKFHETGSSNSSVSNPKYKMSRNPLQAFT